MDQGRRVNQQSLALAREWRRLGHVATVVAVREAKRIDRLTLSNLFTYEHIQQQDGSIYLVLDRPS